MKTNKKAILGFVTAMIFSLAIMQGTNIKNLKQDSNIQQISAVAGGIASSTEGFWSGFSASISVSSGLIGTGAALAIMGNLWHPGGWVAAGVIGGGIL